MYYVVLVGTHLSYDCRFEKGSPLLLCSSIIMQSSLNWCVTRRLRLLAKSSSSSLSTSCAPLPGRLLGQAVPLRANKAAKRWDDRRSADSFADWRRVRVTGGNGGPGCISMLSEWCVEFAGPDGGDGGSGGHVVFRVLHTVEDLKFPNKLPNFAQASKTVKDLGHIKSAVAGSSGGKGQNKKCHGKNAEHTIIDVPLGTVFRNMVS